MSDEMTPTADPTPIDTAAAERRRSPRQRRQTTAWLSTANGSRTGKGQQVRVKDLSLHGVGYVADVEQHKHDTFWMVIADNSLRLSTRLRVIATRVREDGKWDVGAEFY